MQPHETTQELIRGQAAIARRSAHRIVSSGQAWRTAHASLWPSVRRWVSWRSG